MSKKKPQDKADMEDTVVGDHIAELEAIQAKAQAEAKAARDPEPAEGDELAEALKRAEDNHHHYLRAMAELDNTRKRAARELEQARKFGSERLAADLLPVIDGLELGLANAGDGQGVQALREGTEMTLRLLLEAMSRAGIEVIDPQGQAFDPEHHEAMVMQPSDAQAPNTVLEVVQKGYLLNGRVLRPARVVVAKAPE